MVEHVVKGRVMRGSIYIRARPRGVTWVVEYMVKWRVMRGSIY